MATREEVGITRREPGAEAAQPRQPVQEGIENTTLEYYDIMVIGMTGQGKSTTVDKILVANPGGIEYEKSVGSDETLTADGKKKMEDLTMWTLSTVEDQLERVHTRLKNLVFYRTLKPPHDHINQSRDAKMNVYLSTSECELFSNETTKVRALDVPGFYSLPDSGTADPGLGVPACDSSLDEDARYARQNHLAIMRNILRIQAAMKMKFRRILYFLPFRGGIQKGNLVLKQELQLMAYYFGKSIFEIMVLVATMPEHVSKLKEIPAESLFPQEVRKQTQDHVQELLCDVLTSQGHDQGELPSPPIIFISMSQTCESILDQVKSVQTSKRSLVLQFEPTVCSCCSVKVGQLRGENVVCAFGNDWPMPYEDSTCHPVLIPKYTRLQQIKEELVYFVRMKWNQGEPWPDFSTEGCPNCRKEAGQRGCLRVGTEYDLGNGRGTITVKHLLGSMEGHRELLMQGDLSDSEVETSGDDENVIEIGGDLDRVEENLLGGGYPPGGGYSSEA